MTSVVVARAWGASHLETVSSVKVSDFLLGSAFL